MGKVIFGNGQQAGGVFVDAVDNAGAQFAVDTGQVFPQRVEQAVDQGVVLMAGSGVDNKPLGLIDHNHILVFVDDIQCHFHRADIHGFGLRNGNGDGITGIQFVIFLAGLAVAQDTALVQKLLGSAAGQLRDTAGQKGIQPFTGQVGEECHFVSSFQNALLKKIMCTISRMQPQVMKQSATLKMGNSMNWVSIMSTT